MAPVLEPVQHSGNTASQEGGSARGKEELERAKRNTKREVRGHLRERGQDYIDAADRLEGVGKASKDSKRVMLSPKQ